MIPPQPIQTVSFFNAVHAIGWVTLREILREKVLYNVLMATFLIFGVGLMASQLTFTQPERMVLDFGFAAITLSSLFLATLIGANLLNREVERRTHQVALSRPISTLHFVFGKYWGLVQVLFLNWVLLILMDGMLLYALDDSFFETRTNLNLFPGLWLTFMQGCALGTLAMTFASFSTPSLSVILSTGVYLIGIHHSELQWMANRTESRLSSGLIQALTSLLPNFEGFNLGLRMTYQLPVSLQFFVTEVFYGVLMILLGLFICSLIFEKRMGH